MATYINYGEGEEDAVVQGAEWLRHVIKEKDGADDERLTSFTEQFTAAREKEIQAQESGRAFDYGPVFDLFMTYSEDLFSTIPEARAEERVKELESFFALVLHLMTLLEDQDHFNKATTRLCKLFSSEGTQPELRLRLLMMLYNTLPTGEARFFVFKYIVDFSARVGLFDQVLPYLDYIDSWMAEWDKHMTKNDKQGLYCDISRCMREMKKRGEAFQYLKKCHALFQDVSDDPAFSTPDVTEMTIQLLKDAVQLPSVIQFDDILAFNTVKALNKTKHADLVKLCEVFLTGGVSDLRVFYDSHKALFEAHDFSFEDALAKIRLLTLATMAHGRPEILLSEVAQVLEEDEDNVEPWVVRAISEGVIDGRIDQLNHKVLVKSSFQRKFGNEEWAFLDSKLTQWIDNLENVIKFIGDQKTLREGAGAAGA
mmetsp:Transcript_67261/g.187700  ORF Transcript_67261/g.187700 Transcript_67261/m.187700 type:complete len:426 (-) Transcript_67261:28-1305(-)